MWRQMQEEKKVIISQSNAARRLSLKEAGWEIASQNCILRVLFASGPEDVTWLQNIDQKKRQLQTSRVCSLRSVQQWALAALPLLSKGGARINQIWKFLVVTLSRWSEMISYMRMSCRCCHGDATVPLSALWTCPSVSWWRQRSHLLLSRESVLLWAWI